MSTKLAKLIPYYIRYGVKEFLFPDKKNELLRKNFYSQFIKKGDLVFDIGANMGNRIGPILKLGARVVAVEPQKECIKYLKIKFGNKINIVDKALGSAKGVKEIYVSDKHNTISSFSEDWIDSVKSSGRFQNSNWEKGEQIEMTTFDEVIKKYGQPVFAKIDVEGFELDVLMGLSAALQYVSVEYTVPEQTNKVIDCIKRLCEINPHIECNYSKGEEMQLALNKWLSVNEMLELVQSKNFNDTRFGDIYVRKIN